ncbi:glycosyltransferase [Candidatus Pelagibacter sp. HIMB1506]|uniref:glycosyltransferase n=1 Tax=Candidatus Pelagibacter sp. HIMB1506 TaxID=3413337 RepID=UPI003F85774D
MKTKFIVINFFRVTDPYSGGSEVSYNFFKNIPSKNKILFQYSDNKKKHKNVKSIFIKNSKIHKILNLIKLANEIKNYCKNKKKIVIIIEGASWAGYTYSLYKLLKNDLPNAKFIYHSQNIEYVIRKHKQNFLITYLTKYFENYIANNFEIFTCTSKEEKKIVDKIYGIKSHVLSNGLELPKNLNKLKSIKKKYDYIFFGGNIDFYPNYDALKTLVKEIMPKVNYQNSYIKLVVSGNRSLPFNENFIVNVGFVTKDKFLQYLKGACLFVNPMQITFGVQTKTLHALALGKTIIATKDGVAGVKINPKFKNIFICKDNKYFANKILLKLNSKKIDKRVSRYYIKLYKMKNIVENFFLKHNLLN